MRIYGHFWGAIATIWKYDFSPGIGLWILIMLACSSTKRYAFEHNLMATELKCDIYGLCSAIKWPFMAIYTKYMANIVIAYDALVVRGDTVKILYMWDEK